MKISLKKQKQNNGTQQLTGVRTFSGNGVMTDRGELVFFLVRPTNISVLSRVSVGVKVRHLMQLLTAQPDLEICCLDDQECFDDNKEYLLKRMDEEKTPQIRELLAHDNHFLDEIQVQMATARQFMLIVRIRSESEDQSFANLNRVQKSITEQSFEVRRADKGDIKRFLTLYFLRQLPAEELPDAEGETAAVQKWVLSD